MKTLKTTLSVIFLLTACITFAQDDEVEQKTLDNGNLQEQFDYIYNESNNYKSKKVVRKVWLEKYSRNVADSIKVLKDKLNATRGSLGSSESIVSEKDTQIAQLQSDLATVTAEKDQIDLLGIPMQKPAYKTTMWAIIGALLLGLIVFIMRFNSSNKVTKTTKASYQEINDEFDLFKKRTLEKEQQLKRELQDEINKSKF